jgi:hypothetical protein
MRTVLSLILGAVLAAPQSVPPGEVDEYRYYSATAEVTLAGAQAFTIQLPAKSGARVYLKFAQMICADGCGIVTLERNGSAASGTEVTPVALNGGPAPAAKVFRASTATGGGVVGKMRGGDIDLSVQTFGRNAAAAQNLTFRPEVTSGAVTFTVVWAEK